MQVTVNSDCSLITFTSSNFTNGLDGLELRVKYNCSSTLTVFNLNSKIIGITDNSFTLTPTNYYYPSGLPSGTTAPTKFCDGIYYFEVEASVTVDDGPPVIENTVTESSCVFVDCETRCKLVDNFNNKDIQLMSLYYNAITYANDCDECNCKTMCDLYTDLKNMLNITTNDTNCGCK